MNILSWAALAVLVYYAFKGWRRGLIMTVFSMFATVIAIALAAQLSPQLSQNWQNTAYFDAVSQRVEASLFKNQDEQEDTDKEHMIDCLPLPDIVQQASANSDDTQKDVLGISRIQGLHSQLCDRAHFQCVVFCIGIFCSICHYEDYYQVSESSEQASGDPYHEQNGWTACRLIKRHDYSLDSLYYYYYIKRYGTGRLFVCAD